MSRLRRRLLVVLYVDEHHDCRRGEIVVRKRMLKVNCGRQLWRMQIHGTMWSCSHALLQLSLSSNQMKSRYTSHVYTAMTSYVAHQCGNVPPGGQLKHQNVSNIKLQSLRLSLPATILSLSVQYINFSTQTQPCPNPTPASHSTPPPPQRPMATTPTPSSNNHPQRCT